MTNEIEKLLENVLNRDIMLQALDSLRYCVIINHLGQIVYLSEDYALLLGVEKDTALGKPVTQIIPGTKMMEVLHTGREDNGSLITLFNHVKGKNETCICNRRPIYRNGEIIGAMAETIINSFEDFLQLQNEVQQLRTTNEQIAQKLKNLEQTAFPLGRLTGHSAPMRELKRSIEDYATSNLSVLITGETGTGKELVAKAIHNTSNRAKNNYIKINCAAIPKDLIESELFGYEEGAFTGAKKGGKPGKFLLADKGTLLLDEIGELPLSVQAKLLRVLQEKELEPIGSIKPIPVDVRLLSSTNRNLEEMVRNKEFREDLYYRINIVELSLPPLRNRMEDIPDLVSFFIAKQNKEYSFQVTEATPQVLELFAAHRWPGNIRELEHTIERACVLCKSGPLTMEHVYFLKKRIEGEESLPVSAASHRGKGGLKLQKGSFEAEAIRKALAETGGNKTRAAKLLGIDRTVLYQKLKKYNMM